MQESRSTRNHSSGTIKSMSNTKKSLASDEELERFEQFLFEMDDVLEEFVETASQAGFGLEYSAESLTSWNG